MEWIWMVQKWVNFLGSIHYVTKIVFICVDHSFSSFWLFHKTCFSSFSIDATQAQSKLFMRSGLFIYFKCENYWSSAFNWINKLAQQGLFGPLLDVLFLFLVNKLLWLWKLTLLCYRCLMILWMWLKMRSN